MVIAVSGKGGTGKSTIAALLIRYLLKSNQKPMLAVDADPNSNLGEKLGIEYETTVGDLRENALRRKHETPAGTPKHRAIEYEVERAVAEGSGVDLLVMGRGEGPGCYCSVNNMLRDFLRRLACNYRHVIVDNEAGIEHLSRRTNDQVDLMLVVCDQTPTCLKSASRISQLARELGLVRGKVGLLLNRVEPAEDEKRRAVELSGLELFGYVPDDPLVHDFELKGEPLTNLPEHSQAVAALSAIVERIGL